MRRTLLALAASLSITIAGTAQDKPPTADEQAVRAVVEHYLHGLKFNDVASLRQAFWPEARLFFVEKSGRLGQLTQEDWYKGFAANAGKEEAGDLRIAALEVTGDIASVKVVEEYLSLVRFEGAWRIVNKVYTSERK